MSVIESMTNTLIHRGPDSDGFWFDESDRIAMGHRRLAIQDLSSAGYQPMASSTDRFIIVFNGEIYNHLALRSELENVKYLCDWRGHSDTETLLACFEYWGVETTLKKLIGMYSIALWDTTEKILTLIRDRLGEKPLYYAWQKDNFLFGSELKALRAHPEFNTNIDNVSLELYLRYNYVPAPRSIYKNVFKLMPGQYLTLSSDKKVKIATYWSAKQAALDGKNSLFTGGRQEAVDQLEKRLVESIRSQMISDVPLGAFLSGGIDSSTVTAVMQSVSDKPIHTFTIGFDDKGYNEAHHAKAVASHLGTSHTELYVDSTAAQSIIPTLSCVYDEPFADVSQIPTILVSELARRHVTVSLSGDGGDELFAGYNRHKQIDSLWPKLEKIPPYIRRASANALMCFTPTQWDTMQCIVPSKYRVRLFGDKVHKVASILSSESFDSLYQGLVSINKEPNNLLKRPILSSKQQVQDRCLSELSNAELSMLFDTMTYLPDDILVKVDRAAMAKSLETRVPMLDHRIVEFAWSLPMDFKIHQGQSKWILRQVLQRYMPSSLIDRPKMGFAVPIDSWLRGPLRDWVESLINEKKLIDEGIFNVKEIRALWNAHLSGKSNFQHQLWAILMFQQWLDNQ